MIITTESGSLYEIAADRKKVRRLNQTEGTSARAGFDGIWKDCEDVFRPVLGERLIIAWRVVNCVLQTTVTSPVVSIEE